MKKEIYLILIILLSTYLVSATITINNPPKDSYIIGEKISLDITISNDDQDQLIISSILSCPNIELNYFKTPLNLETDSGIINLPSLFTSNNFLGTCHIKINILDLNENLLETINTDDFTIIDTLSLDFTSDQEEYYPGDIILLEINSQEGSTINIYLEDGSEELFSYEETLSSDSLSKTIELQSSISRGEKLITIKSEDQYGNKAESSKTITIIILPVAESISLTLNNKELLPNEDLTFYSDIYDQLGDPMYLPVSYKIYDPNNNLLESLEDISGNEISLTINSKVPGDYSVKATHENFEDVDKFSILEFKEIKISVENGVVKIVNIGNVKFIEDMIITAKVDDTTYEFPISLNLNEDEEDTFDLSTELPSENYDLTLSSNDYSYSLENIQIDDNRPFLKKVSQGISKITGSTIRGTERSGNMFFIGFFVVLIGFFIIFGIHKAYKSKNKDVMNRNLISQNKKFKKELNRDFH